MSGPTICASAAAPKALSAESAGWAALSSRRPPLRRATQGEPARPSSRCTGYRPPAPPHTPNRGISGPEHPLAHTLIGAAGGNSPPSCSGQGSPFRPHPAAECRSLRFTSRQGLAACPPGALPGDRLRSLPAGAFRSARRGRRDPHLFPLHPRRCDGLQRPRSGDLRAG